MVKPWIASPSVDAIRLPWIRSRQVSASGGVLDSIDALVGFMLLGGVWFTTEDGERTAGEAKAWSLLGPPVGTAS